MKVSSLGKFTLTVLAALLISAPAVADEADTRFMQQRSGLLQDDAAGASRQAETLRRQATEYRELADSAEKYAAGASNDKDKEGWLKTAREHRANAEKLEQQAAAMDGKAQDAGTGATDLQNQIRQREAEEAARKEKYQKESDAIAAREAAAERAKANNKNIGIKVNSMLGLWRTEGSDEPFVIVQKDPGSAAYKHVLEAHTTKRVWKGEFHTDPPPGEPLMVFTYKPEAEEMNPEIPEWVREEIEDKLEWKLEINNDGTCGTPNLNMDFYPGEVRWRDDGSEDDDSIRISGKGDARRSSLRPEVFDMSFYSYGKSQLYLRPAGIRKEKEKTAVTTVRKVEGLSSSAAPVTPDSGDIDGFKPDFETVDALVKGQRFHVDVALPQDIAEEQGETLKVKIVSSGGDDTTVELRRGAVRRGRSVLYTHYDPITIADRYDVTEEDRDPPLLSMNYILGYQGARIDLSVNNGELVTFSFGEALQTIPVFNSWVQRSINQHQEAVQRLRNFFTLVVSDPGKTPAQKDAATKRLAMIKNYETIMASDKIHDFIRMKIGDAYFSETGGIISMPEEAWQSTIELISPSEGGSPHPLTDRERDGKNNPSGIYNGVAWIHRYEMSRIGHTAQNARLEYRDTALRELPRAMTFALYETVAGMSGFGDVFTLATGEDVFGKPVQGWQSLCAAIGLFNTVTMPFTLPHVMTPPSLKGLLQTTNPLQLSGRAMRAGASMRMKQQRHVMEAAFRTRAEAAMKRLNGAQKGTIVPESVEADAPATTKPVSCAFAGGKKPSAPRTGAPDAPGADKMARNIAHVRGMYSERTDFARPGERVLFKPQEHSTCVCSSSRKARAEAGQDPGTELSDLGFMVKQGIVKPGGNQPLVNGYEQAQYVAFMQAKGAEVIVIPARGGRPLSLEQMDAWIQRGWKIRDVVAPHGTNYTHAVDVESLPRNAKGQIEEVHWYDPAIGDSLKAPVCDYADDFAAFGHDVILYRFKEGGEGAGRVTAPETASSAPPPRATAPKDEPAPVRSREDGPDEDIDPDSIQLLDSKGRPVSEAELQRVTREARRLSAKLEELYPGNTKPPLNTIARSDLKRLIGEQTWQPPAAGGASFSIKGTGSVRHEVIAVRVRPGHENFVEWVQFETGAGLVPRYWASGKIGVGKSDYKIPAKHLEWIDGDQTAWQPCWREPVRVNPLEPEAFDPTTD